MAAGGHRTCQDGGARDVGSEASRCLPKSFWSVGPSHQPALCLSFPSGAQGTQAGAASLEGLGVCLYLPMRLAAPVPVLSCTSTKSKLQSSWDSRLKLWKWRSMTWPTGTEICQRHSCRAGGSQGQSSSQAGAPPGSVQWEAAFLHLTITLLPPPSPLESLPLPAGVGMVGGGLGWRSAPPRLSVAPRTLEGHTHICSFAP